MGAENRFERLFKRLLDVKKRHATQIEIAFNFGRRLEIPAGQDHQAVKLRVTHKAPFLREMHDKASCQPSLFAG